MTPFEIFISYAKIRGIIPELHEVAFTTVKYWVFDTGTGLYKQIDGKFSDLFNNYFSSNGFGGSLLFSLLYQYENGDKIFRKGKIFNAHRKWLTFVRNNVIIDNEIKCGDTIKYMMYGSEYEGTVIKISNDYSGISVKNNVGNIHYVKPGNILEVNGKPFEFSFHFRWRGKEYGKKT